jgi:hypothetical protein
MFKTCGGLIGTIAFGASIGRGLGASTGRGLTATIALGVNIFFIKFNIVVFLYIYKSELGEMLNKIKAIAQIKAELFEWFLENELKYNL